MVLSFDEAGELLDAMAESFPPAFFSDLNGGILLLPEAGAEGPQAGPQSL